MRKFKFYLLSILLFSVFAFLALLISELTLRWSSLRGSNEKRDHVVAADYMPVRFRPNYTGTFWNIEFSTNRYGFRDEPDFGPEPPPGEFRVLSLGDSIGFGLGVEAGDHYTKVLQRSLTPALPKKKLRVINAGGQGYSPSSYYVYLKHEGLLVHPDMVIVETELCNDVTDEALLEWKRLPGETYPNAIVGGRYRLSWDGNLLGTYSLTGSPLEQTYLYTVLSRRLLNLLDRIDPVELWQTHPETSVYYSLGFDHHVLDQDRINMGWARLFDALAGTQELLEQQGIPFLLLIMPSRYIYQDAGFYTRKAQQIFDRAIQLANERALSYLELSGPIGEGGGADLFFDFAHLTAEGNHIVGSYLAHYLAGQPSFSFSNQAGEERMPKKEVQR